MDILIVVKQKAWQFFVLLMLVSYQTIASDDDTVNLKMKEPMLIASPAICELNKETYLCEMKAALIWEMPKAGHYCLHEIDEQIPLQCWENNWSGSYVLNFQSDKSVTYVLRQYMRLTPLAEIEINVIGTLEQRIRAKRRRGFLRIF